jgi:twitching motility protein PilI
MAKREALRELQSRLAERLQAALTEVPAASWLAVECAGQGLIFPLQGAGEIFTAAGLLPVAHTRPWFLGVANLRGGLHGVVDLAAFLGLRTHRLAVDALGDQSRLLAFNPTVGSHCAVLVDRLAGLRGAGQLTRLARCARGRGLSSPEAFTGTAAARCGRRLISPPWRDRSSSWASGCSADHAVIEFSTNSSSSVAPVGARGVSNERTT